MTQDVMRDAIEPGTVHTSLPYGYYSLLRLFLCGVCLFFAFGARLPLKDWQRWVLGGFAVLYNPVLPIVIGNKGIWEILNVATVVLLWSVSTLSLGQKSGLNRR